MKNHKYIIVAVFLLVFVSSACSAVPVFSSTIEGSGNIITEERNVSGFDRVTLSGFGEVSVQQGEAVSLTVSTDDNIMPHVRTEVRNNTLILDFDDKGRNRGYNPTDGIKFNLVVKDLSRIDISGAGSFDVKELETEIAVGRSIGRRQPGNWQFDSERIGRASKRRRDGVRIWSGGGTGIDPQRGGQLPRRRPGKQNRHH